MNPRKITQVEEAHAWKTVIKYYRRNNQNESIRQRVSKTKETLRQNQSKVTAIAQIGDLRATD